MGRLMRCGVSPRAISRWLSAAERSTTCSWTAPAHRRMQVDHPPALPQRWGRFRVRPPISFYFDNAHLTMGGRAYSIEVARELIPRFLASGARVRIVSSAAALTTYTTWTRDEKALLRWPRTLESRHGPVRFDVRERGECDRGTPARRSADHQEERPSWTRLSAEHVHEISPIYVYSEVSKGGGTARPDWPPALGGDTRFPHRGPVAQGAGLLRRHHAQERRRALRKVGFSRSGPPGVRDQLPSLLLGTALEAF